MRIARTRLARLFAVFFGAFILYRVSVMLRYRSKVVNSSLAVADPCGLLQDHISASQRDKAIHSRENFDLHVIRRICEFSGRPKETTVAIASLLHPSFKSTRKDHVILEAYLRHRNISHYITSNIGHYAHLHGYSYFPMNVFVSPHYESPSDSMIKVVQEHLRNSRSDWVVYTSFSLAVRDFNTRLHQLLDQVPPGKSILLSEDCRDASVDLSFIAVRRSESGSLFLHDWLKDLQAQSNTTRERNVLLKQMQKYSQIVHFASSTELVSRPECEEKDSEKYSGAFAVAFDSSTALDLLQSWFKNKLPEIPSKERMIVYYDHPAFPLPVLWFYFTYRIQLSLIYLS